jgi:hypothetical protein
MHALLNAEQHLRNEDDRISMGVFVLKILKNEQELDEGIAACTSPSTH